MLICFLHYSYTNLYVDLFSFSRYGGNFILIIRHLKSQGGKIEKEKNGKEEKKEKKKWKTDSGMR